MRSYITRVSVAIAATAALGALGVTGVSVSSAAAGATQAARAASGEAHRAAAVPGAQLWAKRYNGPANGIDAAHSVAVSPGGGTVFVTGISYGVTSGPDYATVAYNAATGAQRWLKRYNGTGNNFDEAHSVVVSPGGGTVFVTGSSYGGATGEDYATVAYNAATGAQLWAKRYSSPGSGDDLAWSMAVSPDGGTVFVTGQSFEAPDWDYATVAYNAATGAQRWVKRYNGPANSHDLAHSVAVAPNGSTVFVTGSSYGGISDDDYATVAYNAATGAQRWVKRYNGTANGYDRASSLVVSPGGDTVFVTGGSIGVAGGYPSDDYATVAYNAATGAQRWAKRYNGTANSSDYAAAVAVSPTKDAVFVTGTSISPLGGDDYTTVAYYAPTGARLWVARYNSGNLPPADNSDYADSVAVSPSGGSVYVTGYSAAATSGQDYATVAYDAATGAQRWVKRYSGPGASYNVAQSVAASASAVFVTGDSQGDYLTIGYSG